MFSFLHQMLFIFSSFWRPEIPILSKNFYVTYQLCNSGCHSTGVEIGQGNAVTIWVKSAHGYITEDPSLRLEPTWIKETPLVPWNEVLSWSTFEKQMMCYLPIFFFFFLYAFQTLFLWIRISGHGTQAGMAHTIPLAPKRSWIWIISQIIHLPL